MSKESRNIESWGKVKIGETRDKLLSSDIAKNEKNQAWWEALPMTYEDWELDQREPKSLEDFLRVDRHYFGTNPYIENNVAFEEFKGKKVLEIGCGAGSAACRFAQVGADIVAVDITQAAVDLTTKHAELKGLHSVKTLQADAEDLSMIEDNSFDYLYSWGVMHHSSDPEKCFHQTFLKLKPRGKGLIMVYHQGSLRFWGKGLAYLLLKGKLFQGDDLYTVQRHYTDGFYHKHYTRLSLRESLQGVGYQVDRIDVTHMSSRMIPFIPESLRNWLKTRIGWLIVAQVSKPVNL